LKQLIPFLILLFTFTTVEAKLFHPSKFNFSKTQDTPKAAYMNEELYVTGFSGSGTIEIYSIIGNKINEIKVQDLQDFKMSVPLEKGNMYIIRVLTTEKIHTLKIIASS